MLELFFLLLLIAFPGMRLPDLYRHSAVAENTATKAPSPMKTFRNLHITVLLNYQDLAKKQG